jgi:hypothetical protein
MPAPGRPTHRYGHVAAWIRLQVPPPPAPLVLMGKVPPPPGPPLDLLEPEPVSTDPRKRIYAMERPWGEGVVRLKWDSDAPELLEAEYRIRERRLLAPEEVRSFWAEVKRLVGELGPLPVNGADPRP